MTVAGRAMLVDSVKVVEHVEKGNGLNLYGDRQDLTGRSMIRKTIIAFVLAPVSELSRLGGIREYRI
jgi:hypothetical protein